MSPVAVLFGAIAFLAHSPDSPGALASRPNPETLLEEVVPDPSGDVQVGMDVYVLAPRTGQTAVEALPGHRHPGHMYVYVLEGEVRSKLDDDPAANFTVGQAWLEQPGQLHRIHNLSSDRPARLLVVRLDPAPPSATKN